MLDEGSGGASGVEEFDVNKVLSEDEKGALFRKHFGIISDFEDQVAVIKAKIKNAKAQAKLRGILIEDLNWAMGARQKDTDTVIESMKRRFQIAGWLNFMPQGYQPDLFKDDRSTIQRAYAKGSIASVFNKRPDPMLDNYDPTSEEGQAWMRGFNEERDENRKQLASAEEKMKLLHTDALTAAAEVEGEQADPTEQALPKMAGRVVPKGARGRKKKTH